ncbi:HemY, N-terminal [Candidatus Propionivibrio aalborgensis]|uniref:HemY, N-terminal n=1 Tax=Candidatus Propionivibrio aalborgensis TaxID=1860101 RepID=A0A1A8XQU5_9RHOO|nr:heme biosynthesis HemY N-terminal domain-containing protein [Candidatus Propionivibrio aalborgensis]SBT06338.1 HemY, N-terminal [Candidatus Propionivibrio aalborgensis]
MKGLLWVLTLFALAVGISLVADFNEGYVLLVYPPYRAEISLNLAILLTLGCFVILYTLLRTLALTLSMPRRVREFRERRRREKAAREFYDVARLIFEGRYSQALKKATGAHAAGQSPALAALLAAHSAQRLREPDKQKEWLDRAAQDDPKMQSACLMLEAEMHIEMRCFDEAVAVLKRLQDTSGRHIAALRLEMRAHQGSGNWDEVLRIARLLEKRNALLPEAAEEIKLKAHRENIRLRQSDLPQIQAYYKKLPSREVSSRLALTYAEALMELGAEDEAQRFIEKQLDKEWNPRLVDIYGLSQGGDPASRIARADKWLPQHHDDSRLLLALGRMCLAQRLWGKAQSYLEASLSLEDRREVRLELARLLEETDRADEATPHYRAAAGNLARLESK